MIPLNILFLVFPNGNPTTGTHGTTRTLAPAGKPKPIPFEYMDRLLCLNCDRPHEILETRNVKCNIQIGLLAVYDLIRDGCPHYEARGTPAGEHCIITGGRGHGKTSGWRDQRPHGWIK